MADGGIALEEIERNEEFPEDIDFLYRGELWSLFCSYESLQMMIYAPNDEVVWMSQPFKTQNEMVEFSIEMDLQTFLTSIEFENRVMESWL